MKNTFYFTKIAPFICKNFKFMYFSLPLSPLPLAIAEFIGESPKVFDVIRCLNWNLKSTNCLILESKEDLLLKFGQLIKYNIGKIKKNMQGSTSTIKLL